jgi:3-isopropylmalate/(R)-2-methylmalate dehydratase small subunit
MTPFRTVTGLVALLDRLNVDTDQIIPKQFLKRVERSGFGQLLFYDWRKRSDESLNPDFILNQSRYRGAQILLTRENFGCGSSREHAVWALQDYGFKAILSPSFADIFRTNCFKNGLLAVELPKAVIDEWFSRTMNQEGYRITVNLERQTLTGSDSFSCSFEIDPFHRRCSLEGLDEIGLTLEYESAIAAYERTHGEPWQAAITHKTNS